MHRGGSDARAMARGLGTKPLPGREAWTGADVDAFAAVLIDAAHAPALRAAVAAALGRVGRLGLAVHHARPPLRAASSDAAAEVRAAAQRALERIELADPTTDSPGGAAPEPADSSSDDDPLSLVFFLSLHRLCDNHLRICCTI